MNAEKVGYYIVKARVDGRGGARVFGLKPELTKHFIGNLLNIGGKDYKVTTDGRVNIPRAIMDKYGVLGNDKRRRIVITYASKTDRQGKRTFAGYVSKPLAKDKNRASNWKVAYPRKKTDRALKPADSGDYNWSPPE